jgi:hypothetical protein
MNTRPIVEPDGRTYAIELDMWYAAPRTIAKLIASVDGVSAVKVRRPFSRSADTRIWFHFNGHDFVVTEPWGDSNEYWIGPEEEGAKAPDLFDIDAKLRAYKVPPHRRLLGNLLNLRLRSLVGD